MVLLSEMSLLMQLVRLNNQWDLVLAGKLNSLGQFHT